MTYSVAFDSLTEWLANETRNVGAETAVLAGHFAIFSAGGTAADLLDRSTPPPDGAAEMLDFTRLTWRTACDAAARQADGQFGLVTLVDDIQFVRPVLADRAGSERLAAALAQRYLDDTPALPGYHGSELTSRGVHHGRVVRHSDARMLFSERELRHAAVRHVRAHLSAGGGERAGLTSTDNGNTVTVTLPQQGDYCLVHSGHTTCAGGYVELLSTLYDRGVRKFIAFVPMRCFGPVSLGTELAFSLFSLPGFSVTNVAVPNADSATGVVVDRHGTV